MVGFGRLFCADAGGVFVAVSLSACAAGGPLGLGPRATARVVRPDLFTSDCVAVVQGQYVVCGSARRMFPEDSLADLRREARLDAGARLAASVGASAIELKGLMPAYEWTACEGDVFIANFAVPVAHVTASRASSSPKPVLPRSDLCTDP
jgi:hypothetical protein